MSLGSYDFVPGQNHRIELLNPDVGKTAVADAIRFEWVGDNKAVSADAARFVQNDAQDISYILWDNLFTPKKLVDSTGAVVWDAALKPYGGEESLLGSAVMKLRMPGQYVDEETGRGGTASLTHPLYYNYNRDYDPATGRYTQVDPIGLVGGGEYLCLCWGLSKEVCRSGWAHLY